MAEKRPRQYAGELILDVYTVATLPTAASEPVTGTVALVSDEGVGNVFALVIWDGTAWVDAKTGAAPGA